jgi:hypothetical protein
VDSTSLTSKLTPDVGTVEFTYPAILCGAPSRGALRSGLMLLHFVTQVGLFAAELEARGFLRGIGRTILFIIIILVVIGGLIGFSVARRFGQRR